MTLWNQENDPDWTGHGGQGTNPYRHSTLFNTYFTPVSTLNGLTMFDLVGNGGGNAPARKAARDVVTAYLNASFGLVYPYTPSQVSALWASAVANNSFDALHTLLTTANQGSCPIR